MGLNRHGRHAYCEHCDLGHSDPATCFAARMMEETDIQDVISYWEGVYRSGCNPDADQSEARYKLYRAVVRWLWANPLGAENRVQLPACVVKKIRQLFPNPKCTTSCDFLSECERLGHYVGFRTIEQSRAISIQAERNEHHIPQIT